MLMMVLMIRINLFKKMSQYINNMDKKKKLLNSVNKLTKNYQIEIIKIIVSEKKYFYTFDKNHGFFIDLNFFSDDFVDKLLNYIDFIYKNNIENYNLETEDITKNKNEEIIEVKKKNIPKIEDNYESDDDLLELKKQTNKYSGIKSKLLKNIK